MNVEEIMTSKDLVVVSATTKVMDAMRKMKETGIHQVPVVSGNKYLGMLSYREILRRRSIQPNSKVDSFMIKTSKISKGDSIERALGLLKSSGLPALPVIDRGRLVGILSRTDVLRHLTYFRGVEKQTNAEIMSSDPVTVGEDEDIYSAMDKMRSLDESEIPVVSKAGKLVGILKMESVAPASISRSEDRIGKQEYAGEKEKIRVVASSFMDLPVSVLPEESITKSAEVMINARIHIVPVVNREDAVIGIVGVSDILHAIETGDRTRGVLIQVSGLGPFDDDLYDELFFEAGKFVSRLAKLAGIKNGTFLVHVAKYESGGRTKYSLRTRLFGGSFAMSVNDYDWNFGKCIARIFDTYEKRIKKEKQRT
ncbi:MAG TPA: CBS domain-containing protein [Thermoplasmataceae archaeon]|nr:CBS domain-containing protein [Thermoplasmatales archaeon AK]HLH85876.1 CBS domain-containing protein [Thermoplasmataceae archaeon]